MRIKQPGSALKKPPNISSWNLAI